ncbi:uncharacterized protein BDR25DRAFT_358863 [Lindgomyces ingoldianus]|uniref:Uncharacterized protein n=1 Tax=Lindgomyces ingoldianus TaxID=673940 RepID=A0ACB6QK34_9PLEO|nr:uncharacterized protein BDR25DRAFT_358863 [Lindgomyces ingoldianus]KAF2467319.1 hypothetical protein BDR25DRAFT_358863 [Lindgomyces ingoldianus]
MGRLKRVPIPPINSYYFQLLHLPTPNMNRISRVETLRLPILLLILGHLACLGLHNSTASLAAKSILFVFPDVLGTKGQILNITGSAWTYDNAIFTPYTSASFYGFCSKTSSCNLFYSCSSGYILYARTSSAWQRAANGHFSGTSHFWCDLKGYTGLNIFATSPSVTTTSAPPVTTIVTSITTVKVTNPPSTVTKVETSPPLTVTQVSVFTSAITQSPPAPPPPSNQPTSLSQKPASITSSRPSDSQPSSAALPNNPVSTVVAAPPNNSPASINNPPYNVAPSNNPTETILGDSSIIRTINNPIGATNLVAPTTIQRKPDTGIIVGGAVGGFATVGIIGLLALFLLKRMRSTPPQVLDYPQTPPSDKILVPELSVSPSYAIPSPYAIQAEAYRPNSVSPAPQHLSSWETQNAGVEGYGYGNVNELPSQRIMNEKLTQGYTLMLDDGVPTKVSCANSPLRSERFAPS